jgi:hypothetical protein
MTVQGQQGQQGQDLEDDADAGNSCSDSHDSAPCINAAVGSSNMPVLSIRKAKVAHPTGDPKFEVMQPFPSAFEAEETDPFLMYELLVL